MVYKYQKTKPYDSKQFNNIPKRTFGEIIRLAREKKGLSTRELAQLSGISPMCLKAVEQGRHTTLPDAVLCDMAAVLELKRREYYRLVDLAYKGRKHIKRGIVGKEFCLLDAADYAIQAGIVDVPRSAAANQSDRGSGETVSAHMPLYEAYECFEEDDPFRIYAKSVASSEEYL